jgi:hypothetical protein
MENAKEFPYKEFDNALIHGLLSQASINNGDLFVIDTMIGWLNKNMGGKWLITNERSIYGSTD